MSGFAKLVSGMHCSGPDVKLPLLPFLNLLALENLQVAVVWYLAKGGSLSNRPFDVYYPCRVWHQSLAYLFQSPSSCGRCHRHSNHHIGCSNGRGGLQQVPGNFGQVADIVADIAVV